MRDEGDSAGEGAVVSILSEGSIFREGRETGEGDTTTRTSAMKAGARRVENETRDQEKFLTWITAF